MIMNRFVTIAFCFLIVGGCSTFPNNLTLDRISYEITDFEDNTNFQVDNYGCGPQKVTAPTLVINFTGAAPYAYLKANNLQAQFRCYVMDGKNNEITDVNFARVYFSGLVSPPDMKTDYYEVYSDERYKYKAFVFRELKADKTANDHNSFDLIKDTYDHISCHLVGVQMFGGFMYSNDIIIKKDDVLSAQQTFLKNRKTLNVQSIENYKKQCGR